VCRKHNCQSRFLYAVRIAFKNENEIKMFSSLKKMPKDGLQAEVKAQMGGLLRLNVEQKEEVNM
jgi:hypothetical protein